MAEKDRNSDLLDSELPSSKIDEETTRKEDLACEEDLIVPKLTEQKSSQNEFSVQKDIEETAKEGVGSHALESKDKIEQEAAFLQHIAESVLNVPGNYRDDRIRLFRWTFEHLGNFEREKEITDLDRRKLQAMLHVSYTDLRVKILEEEVRKLQKDIGRLPSDFELTKKPDNCVYRHELKRSTLQEYEINQESKTPSPNQQPALEVLVDYEPLKNPLSGALSDLSVVSQSPRRLRIRPTLLAQHLGRITKQPVQPSFYRQQDGNKSSTVILRPFKILVIFEEEIRASAVELEAKILNEKTKNSKSTEGAKKEQDRIDNEYNNRDLLADLKLLIEFLDVDLGPTFDLRTKIKDGTAATIEFPDLWHLFKLGDDVITHSDKNKIYRLVSYTGGREPMISQLDKETKPTPLEGFTVDCYSLGFTGSEFGPDLRSFRIRKFQGVKPINSLAVYPVKFDTSCKALRESLIRRATRYLALTSLPCMHQMLVGMTLDEPAEEIEGQVIVDQTLAINRNPKWQPNLGIDQTMLTPPDYRETKKPPPCGHDKFQEGCCGSDFIQKDINFDEERVGEYLDKNSHALRIFPAEELTEKDKILLPDWVYGFVLRGRQWVTLKIDDLSDIKYTNNFDGLVLPPGHKESVKALVRNHAKPTLPGIEATYNISAAIDLVRGKGKGLIILLHGEPGVGKTSTAECVADLTQRPLFPITCGDIGETAAEVQIHLDHNFQMAHKWGCVLLLDEADVFMAKRNKTDLRRNSVVSVFLRTLEYYSGILFLTTNRVGNIDLAFKSRIHMSLFYPRLDLEATRKIYQLLIDRTLAEQKNSNTASFKVKSKEIMKFAKSNFKQMTREGLATWNGRQIRNAFQTAITLAEYDTRQPGAEAVTLGKAQFNTVALASKEFDMYMKETLGAVDAELARREGTRHDRFGDHSGAVKIERSNETMYRPSRRNAKDPESEDDDSSDTSEDVDEEDDVEIGKDGLDIIGAQRQSKETSISGPSTGRASAPAVETDEEEYLRWKFQEMKKKQKGKS